MRAKDLIELAAAGRMNRRQFLRHLASVGLAASTFPLVGRRARAAVDLTHFTWAEYDNPAFHPKFVEKYGGSPEFSFFGEEEEALQKLRSGFTPDLAHP